MVWRAGSIRWRAGHWRKNQACGDRLAPRPLCIDLFCGLGGWADGFLAEGYDVVGFDIERHDYGTGGYPAQLVLQDVLTLHGSQFRNAAVIVASPPCQFFSRTAMPFKMPWKQEEYERRRDLSLALFNSCFRIQREASEAAGRTVPLIVENVCGAQKWVGRSRFLYGSFHLWGDLPALMPKAGAIKNGSLGGGSWFGLSATNTVLGMNPDGRKIAHAAKQNDGRKLPTGHDTFAKNGAPCQKLTDARYGSSRSQRLEGERNDPRDAHLKGDGTKFGGTWWNDATNNLIRKASSKSPARKAASAQIAKIPEPLARWIAHVYKPSGERTHRLDATPESRVANEKGAPNAR